MASRSEAGAGLTGTFFGALAFLAFLALAAHTLVSLYATSVLTAVAWDEAEAVAHGRVDGDIEGRLSGFDNVRVEQLGSGDDVGITVSADRPMLLPRAMAATAGFDRIERTVWVREERLR